MERLRFDEAAAFAPDDGRLDRVTIAPLVRGSDVHVAVFRLAPGGRIARHPATAPQLLLVVAGSGRVSGADGAFEAIRAGEAVIWDASEEHETVSEEGLTAVVVEGRGLRLP